MARTSFSRPGRRGRAWCRSNSSPPRDVIRAVEAHGITTLAGVPPLWVQLIEAPWPPKAAYQPAPPHQFRRAPAGVDRAADAGGASRRRDLPDVRPHRGVPLDLSRARRCSTAIRDSIGSAIPFAEVMASHPDGTLCARRARRGNWSMPGRSSPRAIGTIPERTARRFRPAPAGSLYRGPAVWSGDRVRRADGLLTFVGREDAMIKTSGNRVSPTEVEEAAVASGVATEAVALGYTRRAARRGDRPGRAGAGPEADRSFAPISSGSYRILCNPRLSLARRAAAETQWQARPRKVARRADGMTKPMGPIPADFRAGEDGDSADRRPQRRRAGRGGGRYAAVRLRPRDGRGADRPLPCRISGDWPALCSESKPVSRRCSSIAKQVDGLDVASAGEMRPALGAVMSRRSAFAGPGKRDDELDAAISAGVTLNLESEGEAERALASAGRLGVTPRLAVRVNPDFELRGSGMRMGGGAQAVRGRCRACAGARPRLIDGRRRMARLPHLRRLAGARCRRDHRGAARRRWRSPPGSPTRSASRRRWSISAAASASPISRRAAARHRERSARRWRNAAAKAAGLRDTASRSSSAAGWSARRGSIYPRRRPEGEPRQDLPRHRRRNAPPARRLGQFRPGRPPQLSGRHRRPRFAAAAEEEASVVGCLCTPLDRLADDVMLPRAEVGDLVAVFLAGAYGLSRQPAGLSRPRTGARNPRRRRGLTSHRAASRSGTGTNALFLTRNFTSWAR